MLARASSTGETCLIDATGQITARLPLGREGVLEANVPLLDARFFVTAVLIQRQTGGDRLPVSFFGRDD